MINFLKIGGLIVLGCVWATYCALSGIPHYGAIIGGLILGCIYTLIVPPPFT